MQYKRDTTHNIRLNITIVTFNNHLHIHEQSLIIICHVSRELIPYELIVVIRYGMRKSHKCFFLLNSPSKITMMTYDYVREGMICPIIEVKIYFQHFHLVIVMAIHKL